MKNISNKQSEASAMLDALLEDTHSEGVSVGSTDNKGDTKPLLRKKQRIFTSAGGTYRIDPKLYREIKKNSKFRKEYQKKSKKPANPKNPKEDSQQKVESTHSYPTVIKQETPWYKKVGAVLKEFKPLLQVLPGIIIAFFKGRAQCNRRLDSKYGIIDLYDNEYKIHDKRK